MIRRFIDWMLGIGKLREEMEETHDMVITIRDLLIEKIAEVEKKQIDYFEYWDEHWKAFNRGDAELRNKVKSLDGVVKESVSHIKKLEKREESVSADLTETKKACLDSIDSLEKVVVDDMQKLEKRVTEIEQKILVPASEEHVVCGDNELITHDWITSIGGVWKNTDWSTGVNIVRYDLIGRELIRCVEGSEHRFDAYGPHDGRWEFMGLRPRVRGHIRALISMATWF